MINNSLGLPCPECGWPLLPNERLHLDHRIPTSRGGEEHPGNLQVTHATCNIRKSDRVRDEVFAQWR
jgi:5-methylcytosine-specific restriction endonuclease McrA